ncbi:FMN-dependent NADH-azoreductase [Alkalilimnicola ehrlichii]|uniref:FMN dependent NADH:quinone oxidoreductase n=1 Tax=Alkalilimnicola ehrlichii TaxID=351052 RepID=A0A3E0WYS2_9GAMM|nr:NAD(P)H-dependent oxidoreductase [Alkalilimnicola ehrlichii]RFA30594.1 FMN-dependent NADH-azoreductase [Alkalilimnicola ehrlichii]RFA38144.1 FMN-dependent NADH-azoreductase [Alkalilimnicola ehrlichii]
MKALHIDSSILGEQSASRRLSADIIAHLRKTDPSLDVTYRDLAAEPPAHLEIAYLGTADAASGEHTKEAAFTEQLLQEFLQADLLVIGAPMYNLGIPSVLKAWFDRIMQAGKTFRYTETGPQGLAGDKRVLIASTRGGIYSVGAAAELDFQEAYLRAAFGFIGIDDVTFIRAEGLAMGEEAHTAAMTQAQKELQGVVISLAA